MYTAISVIDDDHSLVTCSCLGNELEARPFESPDELLPVIPMLNPVEDCEMMAKWMVDIPIISPF